MKVKEKLRGCPFCGGKCEIERGVGGLQYILCDECGAIISFRDMLHGRHETKDIAGAYNRRAPVNERG